MSPFEFMADGTIKQINPISGTEVWTVPGRGKRPLEALKVEVGECPCAFCWERKRDTPPEKARMLADGSVHRGVLASELDLTEPDFRRIPNLYEIVTFEYWKANYGFELNATQRANMEAYASEVVGREHLTQFENPERFFGGGHDLIVARRHHDEHGLVSAGRLSPDEHFRFIKFAADSMRDLYENMPHANYVVAFQNWLKPAGASFDHLHKQLVAIDGRGRSLRELEQRVLENPNLFQEQGVDVARAHELIISENEYAVLFAGFGHRYPTLEIHSKVTGLPWEHSDAQMRGFSDLVQLAHRAIGPGVPCNEEWHHQPRDVDCAMPWRVNLKLRNSTLAGFEGGTHIYINTISPWELRDQVLENLAKQPS